MPYLLITGQGQPDRTLKELIARAKANPGRVDYASLGVGSGPHVIMEMLANMAGIRLTHIPYKGSFVPDIIAGQIPLGFDPTTTSIPMVRSGKVRALAVTSKVRNPALPDVPTVAEVLPGYDGDGWQGIYVPASTPREIVTRLNTELVKIIKQPDIQHRLVELGLQPVGSSIEQFEKVSRAEYEKWGHIARTNNIRIDS